MQGTCYCVLVSGEEEGVRSGVAQNTTSFPQVIPRHVCVARAVLFPIRKYLGSGLTQSQGNVALHSDMSCTIDLSL